MLKNASDVILVRKNIFSLNKREVRFREEGQNLEEFQAIHGQIIKDHGPR